jgi:hypothetical protein
MLSVFNKDKELVSKNGFEVKGERLKKLINDQSNETDKVFKEKITHRMK